MFMSMVLCPADPQMYVTAAELGVQTCWRYRVYYQYILAGLPEKIRHNPFLAHISYMVDKLNIY